MKQKMVFKVQMNCDKCRTKALTVVADSKGDKSFLGLEGKNKDEVVVIGEGLDVVEMTKNLRDKVGSTEIVSITPL